MKATSPSFAKRFSNAAIGLASQGVGRLITNLLIGRYGGPELLGNIGSAIAAAQISSLLSGSPMGSAGAKFVARARGAHNEDEEQAVKRYLLRVALLFTLVFSVLASVAFALFIPDSTLPFALLTFAFGLGFAGYSFARGTLLGSGRVARSAKLDITTAIFGLVFTVGIALLLPPSWFLGIPSVLALLIYSIRGISWKVVKVPLSKDLRKEINLFMVAVCIGTLASTGFLQSALLVSRQFLGAAAAGNWAAAFVLVTPVTMLSSVLSLSLFPLLSESWGSGNRKYFTEQTDKVFRAVLILLVPVFCVLAVNGSWLVDKVWGSSYHETGRIFPFLVIALLVGGVGTVCTTTLTTQSTRGAYFVTASSLIGCAIGVGLWFILIQDFGLLGLAIGYFVGSLIVSGLPFLLVFWSQRQFDWLVLVARALFLVAISLGLAVLFDFPPLETIAISLFLVAVWFAVNWKEARLASKFALRNQGSDNVAY